MSAEAPRGREAAEQRRRSVRDDDTNAKVARIGGVIIGSLLVVAIVAVILVAAAVALVYLLRLLP